MDSAGSGAAIEVVDTATGAIHTLPNLTHQVTVTWSTLAWKPGDHVLAVTAIPGESSGSGGPAVLLLDLDHDALDTGPHDAFALGWSLDGQALVVGNPTNMAGNSGGELTAVTFLRRGVFTTMPLTQSAAAFVGFIRTA